MTEHTPGPWTVTETKHVPGDIDVNLGDDFRIYIPLMAKNWDHAKRIRMKANAYSIAALPELLDALETWQVADNEVSQIAAHEMRRIAREKREVALAKARGQAS